MKKSKPKNFAQWVKQNKIKVNFVELASGGILIEAFNPADFSDVVVAKGKSEAQAMQRMFQYFAEVWPCN